MAGLSLRHVYKIYPSRDKRPSIFKRIFSKQKIEEPKDFVAVKDFNLEIGDGEFVVFVGPSGCGKSTTLRMIAGLEDISAGELYMDGKLLNNVDAMNRNMAMVFQSYALYPHLSAYDNIAFGLRIRKVDKPVFDKDGNPVMWINKNEINRIKSQIRECNRIISNYNKAILNFESAETDEEKEIAKKAIPNLKKQIELINKKIDSLSKELETVLNTPVQKYTKQHLPKEGIDEKVQWAADILGIKELLNRKPSEMSGGQCQRVALGRAIVRGPKVFLLDEPLSNLDAKLRTSMRSEIVKLHQRLKTTFVYVTHDQIEAMTMGTKIVVMKDGVIQQVDKPTDLFLYPKNIFVAGFIGTPQMNFFDVVLYSKAKKVFLKFKSGETVEINPSKMRKIDESYLDDKEHEAVLGVRAEHLLVSKAGVSATISTFEILGSTTNLFVNLDGEDKDRIVSVDDSQTWERDQKIKLSFLEEKIHLFSKESGNSILEDKQHD